MELDLPEVRGKASVVGYFTTRCYVQVSDWKSCIGVLLCCFQIVNSRYRLALLDLFIDVPVGCFFNVKAKLGLVMFSVLRNMIPTAS